MRRHPVVAAVVVGAFALAFALALGCGGHERAAPPKDTAVPATVPVATPTSPLPPAEPAWAPTSFRVAVSGAGRPVIFIPGLACDGTVWDATVAHLGAQLGGRVQAHVLSLAGFGGVPQIVQPLLPTVRAELVEYIHRNHLDHPIVIGHSLGAFMTFWLAETIPDELGGIIAVDGAPFMPALFDPSATAASMRAAGKELGEHLATMTPADFKIGIADLFQNMFSSSADRDRVDAIAAKSDPRTTGDAMSFLFTTDLRPELSKITVPALVIVADTRGSIARASLEASWHAQIDKIPHHELVVVEQSRHFVMLDQPAAFDAAVARFVAK